MISFKDLYPLIPEQLSASVGQQQSPAITSKAALKEANAIMLATASLTVIITIHSGLKTLHGKVCIHPISSVLFFRLAVLKITMVLLGFMAVVFFTCVITTYTQEGKSGQVQFNSSTARCLISLSNTDALVC